MKNTIPVFNHTRASLLAVIIWLFVCAALLFGTGILCFRSEQYNYSGNFSTVTGIVDRVETGDGDGVHRLFLAGEEDYFLTSKVDSLCDWRTLVGKEVQLTLPSRQRGVEHPLILGVSVGETVLVDPDEAVNLAREDSGSPVLFLFSAVFLIAAVALCFVRARAKRTKEKSLTEAIADATAVFFSMRYRCREARAVTPTLIVWFALFLVSGVASAVSLSCDAPEAVQDALAIVFLVCFSLPLLTAGVLSLAARKKTRNYYRRNFPPDTRDFSHFAAKKEVREQATRERIMFSECFPDTYSDEANDYFVHFSEQGAAFFSEESILLRWEELLGNHPFYEETHTSVQPVFLLPYEELHFLAQSFVKRGVPVVLIRSRFSPETEERLKEYAVTHEVNLVLDRCLFHTLRTFSVGVEDTDGILTRGDCTDTEEK